MSEVEKEESTVGKTETTGANTEKAKEVVGNVLGYGKELMKDPIETAKKYQKESNFGFVITLIVIMIISAAAFSWSYMDDFLSFRWMGALGTIADTEFAEMMDLDDTFESMAKQYEKFDKSDILEGREYFEEEGLVNVSETVMKTAAAVAVNVFVLGGLILVSLKNVLKENVSFKESIVALGGFVFVRILAYLFGALGLLVNVPYSITWIGMGVLMFMSYAFLYEGFKVLNKNENTKIIYVFTIATLAAEAITLFVNFKVLN